MLRLFGLVCRSEMRCSAFLIMKRAWMLIAVFAAALVTAVAGELHVPLHIVKPDAVPWSAQDQAIAVPTSTRPIPATSL